MTGAQDTDEALMQDVLDELEELEETVDSDEERSEVMDVRQSVERLRGSRFLRERIERYTTRDVAESFVGGVLLSLPLLVEDGVSTIADHFLSQTVAGLPVWLVGNLLFIGVMTWGLLYWADFREVWNTRPLLGLVPRRVVGVLSISFLTAALTMTMWGRVEWSEPQVAFARVSVVWTAAAFGAALGDILPGESNDPTRPKSRGTRETRSDGGRVCRRDCAADARPRRCRGRPDTDRTRRGRSAGSQGRCRCHRDYLYRDSGSDGGRPDAACVRRRGRSAGGRMRPGSCRR